ncbi:MAG: PEP-CTERM sorting domain-containing protein [Chthoniobacterales bacterium]
MKINTLLTVLATVAITAPLSSHAQTINWTGLGTDPTDWNEAANWDGDPSGNPRIQFNTGDVATGDTDFSTTNLFDIFNGAEVTWAENSLTIGTTTLANGGGTLNVTGGSVEATVSTKIGQASNVTSNFNVTGGSYSQTTDGTMTFGAAPNSISNIVVSGTGSLDTDRTWVIGNSNNSTINMDVIGEDFSITQTKNQDFRTGGKSNSFFNLNLELGQTGFGLFSIGDWDKKAGITNNLTVDATSFLGAVGPGVLLIDGGSNGLDTYFDSTTIVGGAYVTEIRSSPDGQDLYLVAVPEPGAFVLMGLSTAALVMLRRRSQK